MRLPARQPSAVAIRAGDAAALAGTRFLLALDSDTRLSPGTARTLIGAMLHPLNRPEIDAASGVVRAGYGILAPRIAAELGAATATDFARAFAGQRGSDPYGGESSELYMDLWHCGSYAGKGILDIDTYLACMGKPRTGGDDALPRRGGGRVPPHRLRQRRGMQRTASRQRPRPG
jgi:cyclic beta-1,2-glucan synthetase